jgi:hypothetical protein
MRQLSPETLSLSTLGRADSKCVETTCHGITTAGRPCRKALKKGSSEKFCHIHRSQQQIAPSKLRPVKESDSEEIDTEPPQSTGAIATDYPTPSPSPPLLPPKSPARKRMPSIVYPPEQHLRSPSLQLSPPPSIPPPTPPESIHDLPSPCPKPVQRSQGNRFIKLGKTIRKLFLQDAEKPSTRPEKNLIYQEVSLGTAILGNDLAPSRYPQAISPTGLPNSKLMAPALPPRLAPNPTPMSNPKSEKKVPAVNGRPPTAVLMLAQSRSATTRVQTSWETMWVPGFDGLGAHIICRGTSHPRQI